MYAPKTHIKMSGSIKMVGECTEGKGRLGECWDGIVVVCCVVVGRYKQGEMRMCWRGACS